MGRLSATARRRFTGAGWRASYEGVLAVSMVVGIFDDTNALKPIIEGLKSSGADLERLRVMTSDEIPTELVSSGVQFVWIGDVEKGVEPGDLGTGGTGVPGSHGVAATEVYGDELLEGLSELGVPDGRTDDYARAVEQCKLVVGYPAFSDPSALRQLFSSAGASSIEEF